MIEREKERESRGSAREITEARGGSEKRIKPARASQFSHISRGNSPAPIRVFHGRSE